MTTKNIPTLPEAPLYFNSPEEEPPSRFTQWVGIQDFSTAYQDFKGKNYLTAAKSAALGLLKLGVVGAALYGVYRWAFSQPVFLSDTFYQAGQEAAQNSQSTSVPPSVQKLTETLYHEHPKYRHWPTSAKEFILSHLNSETPVSSAIIAYLLSEATIQDDSSLRQLILKVCKTAQTSTNSCLAALKHFIGLPARATQDTLDNAMKIVTQCNKNTNEYCTQAFQGAKEQSLQLNALDTVMSLVRKIKDFPGKGDEHLPFVEKAIDLFNEHLEEKKRIALACQNPKSSPDSESVCNKHADLLETADYFDISWSRPWFKDSYFRKRAEKSHKELTELLTDCGVKLAKVCANFSASEKCLSFVDQLVNQLFRDDLLEEVTQLLSKKEILAQMQQSIRSYWEQLLASPDAHKSVHFLQLGGTLYPDLLTQTVEKVLLSGHILEIEKLYTIAKTWITEKEIKNQPQLTAIITALFGSAHKVRTYGYRSNAYADPKETMAQVLATLWIKAKKPNAFDGDRLRSTYELHHIPGCSFDQYASSVDKDNWQSLSGI